MEVIAGTSKNLPPYIKDRVNFYFRNILAPVRNELDIQEGGFFGNACLCFFQDTLMQQVVFAFNAGELTQDLLDQIKETHDKSLESFKDDFTDFYLQMFKKLNEKR